MWIENLSLLFKQMSCTNELILDLPYLKESYLFNIADITNKFKILVIHGFYIQKEWKKEDAWKHK